MDLHLYSDWMKLKYPHFYLETPKLKLRPYPDTPTINLKQLKEILLSADLTRNSELEWLKGTNYRFLDGQALGCDATSFISVSRMGNSFLRRFLEDITGIYTGSDMNVDLTLHL